MSNSDKINFKHFIELDNKEEMINSWVGKIHIWYLIRFKVYRQIIDKEFSRSAEFHNVKLSAATIFKYILFCIKQILIRKKRSDILIFGSGVSNTKIDKYYISRIYEKLLGNKAFSISLYEESYRRSFFTPRKTTLFTSDIYYIIAKIKSIFIKVADTDIEKVKFNLNKIQDVIPYSLGSEFWNDIELLIIRNLKEYKPRYNVFKKLLQKTKTRLIVLEDASYGARMFFSELCKDLNIFYSEFQHGLVSPIHPAYNYGESFFNNKELTDLLPDYYFTFGEYWANRIKTPSLKIPIGYSFLEDCIDECSFDKERILLVSDGNLPDLYINLCSSLRAKFPDKQIILKLHPGEYPVAEDRYSALKNKNIVIEKEESIYSLLSTSPIVIGCYSTVLYEAKAYGVEPIVFENDLSKMNLDLDLFHTFSNDDELFDLIEIILSKSESLDNNIDVWSMNTEKNWNRFLKKILN